MESKRNLTIELGNVLKNAVRQGENEPVNRLEMAIILFRLCDYIFNFQ